MILLHYTGVADNQNAINHLCNPISEVSAHYVVLQDGYILQLVAEVPARLARRSIRLGGRDRHQFVLDRHRDRQSRA